MAYKAKMKIGQVEKDIVVRVQRATDKTVDFEGEFLRKIAEEIPGAPIPQHYGIFYYESMSPLAEALMSSGSKWVSKKGMKPPRKDLDKVEKFKDLEPMY